MRRLRLQFTLSSLLGFTLVAGVFLSPLALRLHHKRQERAALAAVATMRGTFYYDWQVSVVGTTGVRVAVQGARPLGSPWVRKLFGDDFFSHVVSLSLARGDGVSVTDSWLKNLEPLTDLDWLGLNDTNVTDAGLVHLRGFRKLVGLGLDGAHIRGPGLRELGNLQSLEHLSLAHTPVDGPGLAELGNLRALKRLSLSDTPIDDNSLRYLKNCRSLKELNLSGTRIAGSGLASLADLPRLTELDLSSTKVTPDGLRSLSALKRLRILWLQDASIDDDCLRAVSEAASLRALVIPTNNVTEAGLVYLTRLPKLEQLVLMCPEERHQDEGALSQPHARHYLDLSWAETPEGEKALEALFPRCEVIPLPQSWDISIPISHAQAEQD